MAYSPDYRFLISAGFDYDALVRGLCTIATRPTSARWCTNERSSGGDKRLWNNCSSLAPHPP